VDASEDDLGDVELTAAECSKERVRRKWLAKHMAINEEIVNISPTVSHAHNGVDEYVIGSFEGLSDTTLDCDMVFICGIIVSQLGLPLARRHRAWFAQGQRVARAALVERPSARRGSLRFG
jgi:hypothetical protein